MRAGLFKLVNIARVEVNETNGYKSWGTVHLIEPAPSPIVFFIFRRN